jgi:hypothetical protein
VASWTSWRPKGHDGLETRPSKTGDLFDFILVQIKGGAARKSNGSEIARLRAVAQRYGAKEFVLFSWKRERECKFETLTRGND